MYEAYSQYEVNAPLPENIQHAIGVTYGQPMLNEIATEKLEWQWKTILGNIGGNFGFLGGWSVISICEVIFVLTVFLLELIRISACKVGTITQ